MISQFGNIEEIKKKFGIENGAEELKRNGILETLFAYFSPDVLTLWNVSWLTLMAAGVFAMFYERHEKVSRVSEG